MGVYNLRAKAPVNGHFEATHNRVAAIKGPISVLQDTAEFSYEEKSLN
jgi:hypothetical protein